MKNYQQFEGLFGLERETLRIDADGHLAQTPHPFESACLERDFCENQLEIITPPCHSIADMLETLSGLDREARNCLKHQQETLWLFSNPPHIDSEDEIPVAYFREDSRAGKNRYRQYLEQKYGKRKMLFSGIHFNFSFLDEYLQTLKPEQTEFQEFKNQFYLKLAKQVLSYSWLLVLLTAASPVSNITLSHHQITGATLSDYASERSSRKGYWNSFIPCMNYDSVPEYTESIEAYIKEGLLYSAAELYLPVRLKPRGENSLESLKKNGINHIELRMFDLNPLEPLGISRKDLEFAHILLVYLSQQADFEFTPDLQEQAVRNHQAAASLQVQNVLIQGRPILERAQNVLSDMRRTFAEYPDILEVLDYQEKKLEGRRPSEQIRYLKQDEFLNLLVS
ncbi:MAG: glutathione synthase [Oscillospiraceae bacterium]|nr:glutathione synthase [Oscillospiraceae bacterium]